MGTCQKAPTTSASFNNAPENKTAKWEKRFSTERAKCRDKDTKALNIFEICYSGCAQNNSEHYVGGDKRHFGQMEVKYNSGKKTKYLYFQIN